jgi:hypothetical protein
MTGDPKLISKEEILTPGNISVVIENETSPTYTSDFSTADGWSAVGGTLNYPISTSVGTALRLVGNGNNSNHRITQSIVTPGKKYRLTGKCRINPGSSDCGGSASLLGGLYIFDGNTHGIKMISTINEWVSFEVEYVATSGSGAGELNFYAKFAGSATGGYMCSTDEILINDIVVTEILKEFRTSDLDFLNRHGGGDVAVSINKRGVSGASGFYEDSATSCEISCSLQREAVANIGHKMLSDRFIVPASPVTLEVKTLVTKGLSGSFLDDLNENQDYDIIVDFKYKQVVSQIETTINPDSISARYILSGAKFDGINYESTVNQNKTATMNFSSVTDFEDRTAGLFVSGKLASYMEDLELNNGDNLTDNDGNNIISSPVYLQY